MAAIEEEIKLLKKEKWAENKAVNGILSKHAEQYEAIIQFSCLKAKSAKKRAPTAERQAAYAIPAKRASTTHKLIQLASKFEKEHDAYKSMLKFKENDVVNAMEHTDQLKAGAHEYTSFFKQHVSNKKLEI